MPFFNFKCTKCEEVKEFMVGGPTASVAPTTCKVCGETDCMEQTLSVGGIGGEVVGGYEYTHGRKSWKLNGTMAEKAGILAGDKDPY